MPAEPSAPDALTLRARGLTKSFGGVTVLSNVDLDLRPGRVHALLGENGAGKSTLIKILAGVVRADRGEIAVDGEPVVVTQPADALRHGIATLFQEIAIVPGLSVSENVFLGRRQPRRFGLIDFAELDRRATELLARLGQRLEVGRDAARLTPVGMTMTAIARALSTDARVVVFDEPTAALTDSETTQLFDVIGRLTAEGVAILYVSHRLDEVFDIADDYTVLRNGQRVAVGEIAEVTIPEVVAAMVGRDLDAMFPPRGERGTGDGSDAGVDTVLELRGLGGVQTAAVDLSIGVGEIVGIAGLAGSGRSEVLRMIAGVQRAQRGEMRLDGAPYRPRSAAAALRAGVAYVPQERRADGLVPASIERNINLTTLAEQARLGITSARRSRRHATGLADRLDLRRRGIDQDVFTLSGGNQQKVVLAKALAARPRVLLLDEPTRGVDVGTKSEIYHLVRRLADDGVAALVVSSELPELLGLCDRIIVMHEGHPVGLFDPRTVTEHELLLACYRTEAA